VARLAFFVRVGEVSSDTFVSTQVCLRKYHRFNAVDAVGFERAAARLASRGTGLTCAVGLLYEGFGWTLVNALAELIHILVVGALCAVSVGPSVAGCTVQVAVHAAVVREVVVVGLGAVLLAEAISPQESVGCAAGAVESACLDAGQTSAVAENTDAHRVRRMTGRTSSLAGVFVQCCGRLEIEGSSAGQAIACQLAETCVAR
jgi:hypothetical protein